MTGAEGAEVRIGRRRALNGGGPAGWRRGCRLAAGPVALVALVLPAAAQDVPNPLLTFSFSSSLNVSDNYDLTPEPAGTSTFLDNTLGLSYRSETAAQFLSFGLSGVARLADLPGEGETGGSQADFDNQIANFEYRRFNDNSELALRGRYSRADLAFFDPLQLIEEVDVDGNDLITSPTGYRETLTLGASFQTGMSGPLGFSLSADTRRRDFIDTNDDDDLTNTTTDTLASSVSALVTPSTRLSLSGTVSHYTAEDSEETDRLSRSLSLGATQETARGLTLNGSLGYQLIDTDETDLFGQRGTTTDDGLIGSLGASQELTNGSIGVQASHSISTSGGRSDVQVFRNLDLPDGSLTFAIGVSAGETGRSSVIGNLDYTHNLASGRILLGLSRNVRTDDDDEELEITRARLGWLHDLTALSSLGVDFDYLATNSVADDGTDRDRGRLRASYNHSLTADWELSAGYEYTLSRREGDDDATENSVFVTIGRDFSFRP